MNQNGSRNVLNWKLSIQHFNLFIEHIKGVVNIPADVFSPVGGTNRQNMSAGMLFYPFDVFNENVTIYFVQA